MNKKYAVKYVSGGEKVYTQGPKNADSSSDLIDTLSKLSELKKDDVLTESEFQEQKKQLLNK